MKSKEVRKTFLEFFNAKKHEIVRSASLIPKNDPTLLFTNAGMVPFKSVFLGEEKKPYVRAASCQKSLRAGGKHNDLENVGHTARHHTFFEMLGNFSFGDYFKKDAILFAWELLTEWYKLPKEKLWVSVYEEDYEAAKLWSELTGMPSDRIIRLGAKDNFWQMGDTGPCGPCSEILIDQGENVGCKNSGCKVGCDCDRFLEIWNLVFMQYNRDSSGKLTPLPKPSIDTGMGMERITAVVQSKQNNFDTDLFSPIIADISSRSKKSYGKSTETDVSMRVIADHIRAIAFLLADGLMPSNEGRGYVMRRIIRRASRHAKMLGFSEPVLFNFIDSVAGVMGDVYPELIDEKDRASKVLRFEEERFSKTLEQGMKIIDEVIASAKKSGLKTLPGSEIFKLYDTYGFPVDLARDIASDNGLMLDESGFNKEMETQRERAKASWVGQEEAISSIYKELFTKIGKTEFIGYETLCSESVVKAILKEGKVINEASKGETVEIFLDKTPFYGESGGQAGDIGEIFSDEAKGLVKETKKIFEGLHSHIVKIKEGKLRTADKVNCVVDEAQRKSTMRNHTSTHLLQASLRNTIGEHVKQSGSFVSSERLRFDFTHFFSLSNEEIKAIEDMVNQKILENISVETKVMDRESAVLSGATALFGEKYGDKVRVISVSGFSSELCGGTHCKATGDIGAFVIVSEGSVASGIRRIEAFTGNSALEYFRNKEDELKKISESLKTDKPIEKVEKLLSDIKELEKQLEKFKGKAASDSSVAIVQRAKTINGITVISTKVDDDLDRKDLRALADNLKEKINSSVIVLASVNDGEASLISMVTKDLTPKFSAGTILKEITSVAGGRGGGKADMAEGGIKEIDKLDKVLEKVNEIVKNQR